ncbi:hypothetical protein [Geobacter pickeringii]|uniref:Uncharacterized protein n=1 Tax=Geobacter pickeringii TaxID=345632 RepID=A0A0B5BE05_9BACT|nr:hypothetical protein [Geobacter pickeringii]AJE03354.1 hypothetical protein GPICK_08300 [Geobacter pickeringii]
MAQLIRELPLENGLTLCIFDHTRHYFGDFHLVKLELTCEISLSSAPFDNAAEREAAQRLLGAAAVYRRFVEQMGVPTADVQPTVEQLIGNFTTHSLPYLSSPDFARRFVSAEFERAHKKKSRPTMGYAAGRHD